MQDTISRHIAIATGQAFKARSMQPLSGGDINAAFRFQDGNTCYFVKLNRPELADMFAAELTGLQELAATQTLRVPNPIVYGKTNSHAFLVLEYLELSRISASSERLLGQQLAQLHQFVQPYFGWHRDNTIGSTLQRNQKGKHWPNFWRDQRLDFQLQLAAKNGYGGRLQALGERLCDHLDLIFADYTPTPSLLHGDLWAGNVAMDKQGNPVIFDPACYYGDREADLAMTELFGGFSRDFYAAYQTVWPLNEGYKLRKSLYNLYHVLNHLNLFGGGYLNQTETIIASLLSEIGVS